MILSALCTAAALYGEARGESIDGQIAIADVIRTRVESPRYPDNACDVVFAPAQFAPATRFDDPDALLLALSLAFSGETLGLEATHFHSQEPPYWAASMTLVGQIDEHWFYMEGK